MRNRLIFTIVLGTLLIGILGVVSAQTASYVNHQYRPSATSLYGADAKTYWPILDNPDQCEARQDILLNLAPLGCEPAVVRSDLLAEQDVPVFCQVDGMNINPLLDIEGIRNIRFRGEYPREVAGVGYHPARAALKSRDLLLGDPLINNLGYVVVVLKRQMNESAMPDFVEINLSAQMEYAAGNAFGVGQSEFMLEEQTLEEFRVREAQQSFWDGRFSIRAVNVDPERADIEIWQGDFRHSSVTLRKGEKSLVYVPGSYCAAALGVYYDGFEANKERAMIEIGDDSGSDVLWVYEGSRFLNNKCVVRNLEVNESGIGKMEVSCGSERISLETTARVAGENLVNLNLDNGAQEFEATISAYEKVADDYPAEASSLTEREKTYGEEALVRAIKLAENYNQAQTEARLLNKFLELYPESSRVQKYRNDLIKLREVDRSLAGEVVLLDNRYRTIRVLDFEPGPVDNPSVTFSGGKEGSASYSIELRGTETGFEEPLERVRVLDILNENEVRVGVWCKDGDRIDSGNEIIMSRNIPVSVCNGAVELKVEQISDFEKIAKVRIVPETRRTESEASLSLKIGIEKRAIELSPEKINEKMDNLNKSVERWNKLSDSLGEVVEGMKVACYATSAALIAKNFISGTDGSALARQQAMNGIDGWKAKCSDEVARGNYVSMSACFNDKKDLIEGEVQKRASAISATDNLINNVQVGRDVSVYDQAYNSQLIAQMKQEYGQEASSYLGNNSEQYLSHSELRELAYNLELKRQGVNVDGELERLQGRIDLNREFYEEKLRVQQQGGLVAVDALSRQGEALPVQFYDVEGGKVGGQSVQGVSLVNGQKAVLVRGVTVTRAGGTSAQEPGNFLVVGNAVGNELSEPSAVYRYENVNGQIRLSEIVSYSGREGADRFLLDNQITRFRGLAEGFSNEISPTDRFVRYFGTGPDSGLAAVVPFNSREGWYARVISVSAQIPAYESSGNPKTWEICNVGADGRIDVGDECQIVFTETAGGVPILGLGESKSRELVQQSRQALLEANSQKNSKVVRILGEVYDQGELYSHYNSAQCQDFMSINDCQLLFNVCDPVICPSSRCDLGGEYPVADVVQTGIVGSALLCLPNFIGFGGDVAVPVCLTGVKAGIDGYVSILESHQQCLAESLETGRQIGICDQISSVYMCDFFWRQVTPVAREVLPRLVSGSYNGFGRATRGGGEYSSVQAAFDNADASINYFTQSYAVNSLEAFRARSIEDAGTEFCKAFVSLNVPTEFETLIVPESPPQFHAWFSSQTYTDVTVPATAQYKVFYHIFAGEVQGASFSVYLKDPPSQGLYAVPSRVQVASGFVGRGDFATESKDFTAPEGYKQLCVLINGEEECGFKQVSSSFAVNYLRDGIVKEQIEKADISSSQACIAGSTSAAALLNPNIQAGAEEALSPEIYNRGVVRICASRNPGQGTEPARFVDVGYCDNPELRCWLDKKSVDNAITNNNVGVQDETLQKLEQRQRDLLIDDGNLFNDETGAGKIEEYRKAVNGLRDVAVARTIVNEIDSNFVSFFYNHQKAAVLLVRAQALEFIFEKIVQRDVNSVRPNPDTDVSTDGSLSGNGDESGNEERSVVEPSQPERIINFTVYSLENGVLNSYQSYTPSHVIVLEVIRDTNNCEKVKLFVAKDGRSLKLTTLQRGTNRWVVDGLNNNLYNTEGYGNYQATAICLDNNGNEVNASSKTIFFEVQETTGQAGQPPS